MPFIVTGISQDGNTSALEAALKAAGYSLDSLDIVEPGDADVSVGGSLIDTGILTGGGLETGTGVPGLTGSGTPGISSSGTRLAGGSDSGSLWDRLADLAIPDDEVENYAEALEAGRTIVAFHGDAANVSGVETLFRDGGLTKVKTY